MRDGTPSCDSFRSVSRSWRGNRMRRRDDVIFRAGFQGTLSWRGRRHRGLTGRHSRSEQRNPDGRGLRAPDCRSNQQNHADDKYRVHAYRECHRACAASKPSSLAFIGQSVRTFANEGTLLVALGRHTSLDREPSVYPCLSGFKDRSPRHRRRTSREFRIGRRGPGAGAPAGRRPKDATTHRRKSCVRRPDRRSVDWLHRAQSWPPMRCRSDCAHRRRSGNATANSCSRA